jgi:hypothetical protein
MPLSEKAITNINIATYILVVIGFILLMVGIYKDISEIAWTGGGCLATGILLLAIFGFN